MRRVQWWRKRRREKRKEMNRIHRIVNTDCNCAANNELWKKLGNQETNGSSRPGTLKFPSTLFTLFANRDNGQCFAFGGHFHWTHDLIRKISSTFMLKISLAQNSSKPPFWISSTLLSVTQVDAGASRTNEYFQVDVERWHVSPKM